MQKRTNPFFYSGWILIMALSLGPVSAQQTPEKKPEQAPTEEKDLETQVADLLQKGQELVNSGEFNEAAALFKQAVDMDENNQGAWFLLGYALHMDKQLEPALDAHKKAAEFDGQLQATATYNVGCALNLLGRPGEALDALRKSVELGFMDANQFRTDADLFSLQPTTEFAKLLAKLEDKDAVVKQLDEAQQAIDAEQFDDAAKIYEAILNEDKQNAFACYRLGYALHGAGKLDEAIKYHERATKFPGTRGIANYNWGCALSLKGDKELALKKLTAAVEHGFVRLDAYQNDPDLNNLREEKAFQQLVAALEAYANGQAKTKTTTAKSEDKTEK